MNEFDLIIRNGIVVDGSGTSPTEGDVGISGSRIEAVGRIAARGREEIDARGKLVTPGFVDIHTHYDGQVTWENRLGPSSQHGVTTVVTGNCGVGFAPCRPQDRERLVKVMEGVEDIPEVVMTEGLPWNWQTFPEYMDAVAARAFDMDVALQIPHSPIRVYVMGERGANHEPSTEDDRRQMTALVAEAMRHGAIGVSTSRSFNHHAKDGTPAPSVDTANEEVLALARGLRDAGRGVFQLITESSRSPEMEMALVQDVARIAGRPVSFTLTQLREWPGQWRALLDGLEAANAAGHRVRGQISPRPVGILVGLELSLNPLMTKPSYRAIAQMPLAQRVVVMRDPDFKRRVLEEQSVVDAMPLANRLVDLAGEMFYLEDRPNFVPPQGAKIADLAAAQGRSNLDLAYDLLLEEDGHAILCLPSIDFSGEELAVAHRLMTHPDTVIALGDGGAHLGILCDAGYPTHLLTYWARDCDANMRVPIEWAVHALTRRPAETVGLLDRGLLAPGFKADINIIDHIGLTAVAPRPTYDLPAGGKRLQQRAKGYEATIVSGQITRRFDESCGCLPGRLVRVT